MRVKFYDEIFIKQKFRSVRSENLFKFKDKIFKIRHSEILLSDWFYILIKLFAKIPAIKTSLTRSADATSNWFFRQKCTHMCELFNNNNNPYVSHAPSPSLAFL